MGILSKATVGLGTSIALSATVAAAAAQEAYGQARASAAVRAPVIKVRCDTDSLSAAVTKANTLGTATLALARNCTYRYSTPAGASSALPHITGNITMVGESGTRIIRDPSASENFRIIDVAAEGRLRGVRLSIQNGNDTTGGGILNSGRVSLYYSTLSGNVATLNDGGGFANGSTDAEAVIYRSTIKDNTGSGGAGILNSGKLRIISSRITSNSAPEGGGGGIITNLSARTTIERSLIDHNSVGYAGGGILNYGYTSLYRTLIANNRNSPANGFPGGGIHNVVYNTEQPGVVVSRRSVIRSNLPDNCYPAGTIPGCVR